MRRIAKLLILGGVNSAIFAFCGATVSASEDNGWILTQFHEINGKEVTYIAKNFVRLDRLNNEYSVIIDEKKGNICFFSDKQRLLFKSPIKGFNHQTVNLLRMFTGDSRAGDNWKRIGATKVCNIDAVCFESLDYIDVVRGAKRRGNLASEKRKVQTITSFYVSKEIAISKEVSRLLSQLQGTKDLGLLPLKEVTTWKEKSKTKTNLDLLEIEKAEIDSSKGRIPKGYRETIKLSDITNKDKSSAEELLCK